MHARAVAVSVARREARNISQSMARSVGNTLDAANGAMRALALQAQDGGTGAANIAGLRSTMVLVVATVPGIHNLLIADARGRVIASNLPASPAKLPPVADRPYFLYHRSHSSTEPHISGPTRSRTDGSWVIFVTRRIDHRDGSFAGVAVAPIALDYLLDTFNAADIGKSGCITLRDDDGTILARRPFASIGTRSTDAAMPAEFRGSVAASYIGVSPGDGVRRLFAVQRLIRYPLEVKVGLAESEYLAAWHADALANYSALAGGTGIFGILAGLLGAQIVKRKRAEDALELASTDGLTGLANRRRFEAVLEMTCLRAAHSRTPVGLLIVEVANLKAYNDRHGHQAGDELLISIGRTIFASIDSVSGLAARYDGLTFAVMQPNADTSAMLAAAERIHRAIQGLVVDGSGDAATLVPVTIGTASTVPANADDSASLVDAAFRGLHEAKHAAGAGEATALEPVDTLTGVANRRHFDIELDAAWKRAAEQRPVGLLMIGINNLKAYNDHYGRQEGDELLIAIARAIGANAPAAALPARYNGLSFAVLLPDTDAATIRIVADKLRAAVHGVVARYTDVPKATVTVNVGAASLVPTANDGPSRLIGAAIVALHTGQLYNSGDITTASVGETPAV